MAKKFLLLNEIDEKFQEENLKWNENAFQTLLTSNLPPSTIVFYAVDVAFRRLENSLNENFWNVTAEALHDLSQYLLSLSIIDELQPYIYEAKCQLLFFASIALIKFHRLRHRSMSDAKLSCAAVFLLLSEQSQTFEMNSNQGEYSSCIRSMRCRFYKRIFLTDHWLPTLSDEQFRTIENQHEKLISLFLDQLFPSKSLRDRLNDFIEFTLSSCDAVASDFVVVPRFPRFRRQTIEKHVDLHHIMLTNTFQQRSFSVEQNSNQLFVFCLWTLCCSIEIDRHQFAGSTNFSSRFFSVLTKFLTREHFVSTPIDFEEKILTIQSLQLVDLFVFLLLCAQQNVRTGAEEPNFHPLLLYSSSNLFTKNQQKFWSDALKNSSSNEFLQILSIVRLNEDFHKDFPPISILLRTAEILFEMAKKHFEQFSHSIGFALEQYAIQYLQTAKKNLENPVSTKTERQIFFFSTSTNFKNDVRTQIEQCEQFARQCDELKSLPEPISFVQHDDEDDNVVIEPSPIANSPVGPLFRDIDVQTTESLFQQPPIIEPPPSPIESVEPPAPPPLPPFVGMIFTHMNGVNQWINRYCIANEGIQNDIHALRDRLEKLNRVTSQMVYDNINPNANSNRSN